MGLGVAALCAELGGTASRGRRRGGGLSHLQDNKPTISAKSNLEQEEGLQQIQYSLSLQKSLSVVKQTDRVITTKCLLSEWVSGGRQWGEGHAP